MAISKSDLQKIKGIAQRFIDEKFLPGKMAAERINFQEAVFHSRRYGLTYRYRIVYPPVCSKDAVIRTSLCWG